MEADRSFDESGTRVFRAMGTRVTVRTAPASIDLADHAQQRLDDLEARWSRFIDSSEVCALNRSAGLPTIVSPETLILVAHAILAHELTGGIFDPTVLDAVVEAGYDRSHELLRADPSTLAPSPSPSSSTTPSPSPSSSTTAGGHEPLVIQLDEALSAVTLPATVGIDPGGIGKGLACDLVTEELIAMGATSVMLDLGGDMRLKGPAFGEPCWTVQIEDPHDLGRRLADIHVTEGAVATSSRARRRWLHHGMPMHHLIDPRTGAPSDSDVVAVTVVGSTAWWADVLAKAALVAGLADGAGLIERAGCSALLVSDTGEPHIVGGHVRLGDAA